MFCPNAIEWGDVGTWVGGGATALTLMFLVVQWWRQLRSEQASRVCGWLWREGDATPEARLGNSSGLPIYDVFVYHPMAQHQLATDHDGRLLRLVFRGINRWEVIEFVRRDKRRNPRPVKNTQPPSPKTDAASVVPVLPPGDFKLDINIEALHFGMPAIGCFPMFGLELVFTDSRGKRWTRRANGKLSRSHINPHWFYRSDQAYSYATVLRIPTDRE